MICDDVTVERPRYMKVIGLMSRLNDDKDYDLIDFIDVIN